MSYLCYSLDEAAKQLGMSETVLFRLSQFLKIPANAYDDVGYIAFNGDLSFSDDDLAFFKQVKERLLKGETLETIKQRMRSNKSIAMVNSTAYQPEQSPTGSTMTVPLEQKGGGIKTIETLSHLKKEAAKRFNRYKLQARPRLNQVFHNLAQQLTDNFKSGLFHTDSNPSVDTSFLSSLPSEPLWDPASFPEEQLIATQKPTPISSQASHTPPLSYQEAINSPTPIEQHFEAIRPDKKPIHATNSHHASVSTSQDKDDSPWLDIIHAANQSPRALNVRLRAAAQTLRQKALYQMQQRQLSDS